MCYVPNQQRWHAKWKLSRNTHTLRTCFFFFARLAPLSHSQSVLIDESICVGAQSEAYQECVVGWALCVDKTPAL